jgi:hypothetical protein
VGVIVYYILLFFFSRNIQKARSAYFDKQVCVAAFTIQANVPEQVWAVVLRKHNESLLDEPIKVFFDRELRASFANLLQKGMGGETSA